MIALPSYAARRRANVRAVRPRFRDVLARYVARDGREQIPLARAAGINHSTVSRLLSGSRQPSREMIDKLAGAMGLEADEHAELLILAGFVPRGLEEEFRLLAALEDADRETVRTLLRRLA